ncbi:MAG: long-chain-fatty-acid--CoA ligase [Steroidobacteraceae bacterium]
MNGGSVSLVSLLDKGAANHPFAPAVRAGSRIWSYADLDREATLLCSYFTSSGLQPGERVATLARNCGELVVTLFACLKCGLVYTPLNFRYSQGEAFDVLLASGAAAIVAGPGYCELVDNIRGSLAHLRLFIGIGHAVNPWTDFAMIVAEGPRTLPPSSSVHHDRAILLYTSGTTGRPKGVLLGHYGFLHLAHHAAQHWKTWAPDDVNLVVVPLFHVGGIVMLLVTMAAGGLVILHTEFNPAAVLRAIGEDRITRAFFVPAMIQTLLQAPECERTDFSSLRLVFYAAAPMPAALLQRAMAAIGCDFAQVYGMTETSGAVTYLDPQQHRSGGARVASCGRALPGTDLRIVDQYGQDLTPGHVGEILIRTCQLMRGYFEDPIATAAVVRDGWFHSGDAGELDSDGYLYVRDRIKDMIISGGENVYPAEVENVLFQHESIADTAVVGIPDARFGEAIAAFVVIREAHTLNEESVRQYARKHLAGYKVPKRVMFVTSLPRNSAGKILKDRLRSS